MLSGVIFADSIQNYDLEAYIWINGLAQLVLSFALLLIMRKLQLFNRSEYSISGFGKGLFAGLLGIVFALFMFLVNYIGNVSFAHVPSFSYLFACLLIALTTGLFEELLVRGFAFNSFKECFGNSVSGIKKAIVWSSVLFGLIHVVNLGGYDLASVLTTLSQIISAIIVGMFFALVYVQSKNLLSVIIIHALIDAATFVLYSLLSVEAFQSTDIAITSTLDVVMQSFIMPLVIIVPFLIAVVIKWRKLKSIV